MTHDSSFAARVLEGVRERFADQREADLRAILIAVHAAYRVGAIDVILSDDVQEALPMPGIFRANMEGERKLRLRQLAEAGFDIDEWRIGREGPRR